MAPGNLLVPQNAIVSHFPTKLDSFLGFLAKKFKFLGFRGSKNGQKLVFWTQILTLKNPNLLKNAKIWFFCKNKKIQP